MVRAPKVEPNNFYRLLNSAGHTIMSYFCSKGVMPRECLSGGVAGARLTPPPMPINHVTLD
jgi:hypothetical protein